MRTSTRVFVVSLCLAMTSFAADKPADAKALEGTWQAVEAQLGGQPMKAEVIKSITLKMENGKYEVTAENVDKGTYTIDPEAKPKAITIKGVEGPNVGKTIPAIYELNDDSLSICYGLGQAPRPTEFKSTAGTTVFLVKYKRKKA
jgi:uncharacterized protein (TIGR03067 family)